MSTTTNIYTPPGSVLASSIPSSQIRLLLHGKPASGKTTAALTAPNPVVADFDNGAVVMKNTNLTTIILPFFDKEWVNKICPNKPTHEVFKWWLNQEARKLTSEQTLIIDSLSSWDETFHIAQEIVAASHPSKSGEVDERAYVWGDKLKYFRDCHVILRGLKCNIVVTAHDSETRDDKTGMLITKVKPAMTGSYADKIGKEYTDIFHQECKETKDTAGKATTVYTWRTRGDSRFDLRTRMKECPDVVPASWASFKY